MIIFFFSFIFFLHQLQLLNPSQQNLPDRPEIAQDEEDLLLPQQVALRGQVRRPKAGGFQVCFKIVLSLMFGWAGGGDNSFLGHPHPQAPGTRSLLDAPEARNRLA